MEKITIVPREIAELIPKFDGEANLLNIYIRKCEYVIHNFRQSDSSAQELYLFHVITSRLTGKAAFLISEREDICSWQLLKDTLIQHFGDPRSEECVAIEMESLKIKTGESYTDFCKRIQHIRSILISKVNRLDDMLLKESKIIIYNNLSLNVFLYNLPEHLIRIVRLKNPRTLEAALEYVTEEVNFQFQYDSKNNIKRSHQNQLNPSFLNNKLTTPQTAFRTAVNPFQNRFTMPGQINQGFRPSNNFQNQLRSNNNFKFGASAQPNNFRFGIPNQQQNFKFGIPQQNQVRNLQHSNNYQNFNRQANQSGHPTNQNQFKFGIPRPLNNMPTDVSMRTAPQVRQNMTEIPENVFYNNDLEVDENYHYDNYCETYPNFNYDEPSQMPSEPYFVENSGIEPETFCENPDLNHDENFCVTASKVPNPK